MFSKKNCSIKYIMRKSNIIKDSSLFLMIHGYGSNENNLFFMTKDIPKNLFVVSIRGLFKKEQNAYHWYDIDFSDKKKFINIEQAKVSIDKISMLINDIIQKYQLNNHNVWLCGFSQGAILSYAIALKNFKKVKKIIALSGYVENNIFSKLHKNSNCYDNLDFFISHGKYDNIIPINLARQSIKILNKIGVSSNNLCYNEYNSEHTLCETNYKDIINWINNQN
ncbi:alpha/beta hydrolase [Blattabacterium cuenoti]|uniref:alpha/beta hydrolase n=1 Tax=Blattabacterium cuenoti TaxID=1653831 RepID=UPI00163CDB79|nr:phospholipase [Blattabacterium cuenoti]